MNAFDCVVLPEDARQRLIFGQAMQRGMQGPLAQVKAEPPKRSAVPIVLALGVLGAAFYIFFATLNIKHK
jgi:hypothetical protein